MKVSECSTIAMHIQVFYFCEEMSGQKNCKLNGNCQRKCQMTKIFHTIGQILQI
jgi:hypothetical protein